MRLTPRGMIAPLLAVAIVTAGCGRDEPEVPPAQAQTQTAQPMNMPTTQVGCLRAGEASQTYVLTTSRPSDGSTPATYDLVGSAGVNLQEHVGRIVTVRGVVTGEQQIATREPERPAERDVAATPAKPGVQTSTRLALRRLEVQSIEPTGEKCG